ncbi:MAG: DUF2309 family protein [Alphaproteobacteria bacterium]|nr:DUF2309 family protein [Alphaproteobacteria bacterium]
MTAITPLPSKLQTALAAADGAVRAIPPVWPLAATVAVNPYLGQTGESLAQTGARLARVAGAPVTMPRSWFKAKIEAGEITDADLAAAAALAGLDIELMKSALNKTQPTRSAAPTVADLAAKAAGIDWTGIVAERIGAWAAGFFDAGQALWAAPRAKGAWRSWSAGAQHDLTPEILGLKGFAAFVADAPDDADVMIARAAERLGLAPQMMPTYFHQLLLSMGGWAQAGRYKLWMAELGGGKDSTALEMLAIRLAFEVALYEQHESAIAEGWEQARTQHAAPLDPDKDLLIDAALQEAAERATQRGLAAAFALPAPKTPAARPTLQAALCIDVRSEVFRRALESVDPRIETLGFAGFFGLGASHRSFASDVEELRLPVLLNPGVHSCSGGHDHKDADHKARVDARGKRAWGRFKLAAVSSFAFVESAGPLYLGKLIKDALGLAGKDAPNEPAPQLVPALDQATLLNAAETILRAMSLTSNFARVVLLAGHGAQVVNNPHASALACGACGGYSGEVNARLLAGLLNLPSIRAGLIERGITVPEDTLFVAALHDTTSDTVTVYTDTPVPATHAADMTQVKAWLETAGSRARGERSQRLPGAKSGDAVLQRSRDWAQVRPEWALAGCKAFIAAPRSRTAGRSLEGRAFLHNYDWRADTEFKVLELILTAPVVVASWISLQYYGSTVSPDLFGGGDKTLHNVVGGIGVVEGNGGLLRVGLPWQSVHDGEKLMHDPLRLSVCVEAPREAMSAILERHPGVRALFDNRWLHLFALDDQGQMVWRYAGDLAWVAETPTKTAAAQRVA